MDSAELGRSERARGGDAAVGIS